MRAMRAAHAVARQSLHSCRDPRSELCRNKLPWVPSVDSIRGRAASGTSLALVRACLEDAVGRDECHAVSRAQATQLLGTAHARHAATHYHVAHAELG